MRIALNLLTPLFICACSSVPEHPFPEKEFNRIETNGEALTKALAIEFKKSFELNSYKWKSIEPLHYTYMIAGSGWYQFPPAYGPNEVEIINGEVVKITYRGEEWAGYKSGDKIRDTLKFKYSIDDMFARVSNVLDEAISGNKGPRRKGTPNFTIEYHPEYNFPVKIAFDDPTRADEQWAIIIESMTVIE